jgi:hypothetical protein
VRRKSDLYKATIRATKYALTRTQLLRLLSPEEDFASGCTMGVFGSLDIWRTPDTALRNRNSPGKTHRQKHQNVQPLVPMSPERQARRTEYLFSMIPKHLSRSITSKRYNIYINAFMRIKLCRNETVKPLPPARLLSEQGSRRRSGLVVFLVSILRPGRVP